MSEIPKGLGPLGKEWSDKLRGPALAAKKLLKKRFYWSLGIPEMKPREVALVQEEVFPKTTSRETMTLKVQLSAEEINNLNNWTEPKDVQLSLLNRWGDTFEVWTLVNSKVLEANEVHLALEYDNATYQSCKKLPEYAWEASC